MAEGEKPRLIIPALSVRQPYASLVAAGFKSFYASNWAPRYRGVLAIHASKGVDKPALDDQRVTLLLITAGITATWDLPRGGVVALARLHTILTRDVAYNKLGARERLLLGDGSFIWWLRSVVRLPNPIPARGRFGLWEWEVPAAVMPLVRRLHREEAVSDGGGN